MEWTSIAALGIGALAAFGVLVLVNELMPAAPALGAALHRLHPDLDRTSTSPATGVARRLLRRVPVPHENLALIGRTTHQYYLSLLAAAGFGLAVPVLAGFMLASSGRQLPAAVVGAGAAVSLASAAGFALAAHGDVAFKAKRLRREYRQVVAVYLSLVAMERGAGHGSVESLERASAVGEGWVIRRIREALLRARSHHRPPWDELKELGDQIGVAELRDVGQIMQSSGQSGAQVSRTLLQRADSLRDQIRTEALARAESTTGKLEIPGALLLAILAVFVIYPITQRIYIGLG